MSVAAGMIRGAADGTKHDVLLRAAKLCGGYIAVGRLDEDTVKEELFKEIVALGIEDEVAARRTIDDGIEYGKNSQYKRLRK